MARRRNHNHSRHGQASATVRRRFDHSLRPHTRPGTIVAPDDAHPPLLRVTAYGPDELVDRPNCSLKQIEELRGRHPVTWIDATGLEDVDLISRLGKSLGLHPLALEDMTALAQRPKVEEYPHHLYAVSQIPSLGEELAIEQVSIFIGRQFVLTWRERPGPCFDHLRKRLQITRGVTRSSGVDYLTYAVLDAVVDSYFPVVEKVGTELDELDDSVDRSTDLKMLGRLRDIRHQVRQLRRVAWPMRDAIDFLMRKPDELIGQEATIHLRDCHDHVVQIIDSLENCRDACADLRDYYATAISNRMNEIMKVLTVISTIFMPLSFVAGVYGMNFHDDNAPLNMPELRWKYGYVASLALMGTIAAAQLWFFYRRGWLRRFDQPSQNEERGG